MSIFDWADRVDADPPFLRDRLPEILGDRPWWEHPHSIRTRVTRRTLAEIEEEFRQAARDAYLVGPGFIVPDALRASLAGILECERLGRPYVDPELWDNAVRTRPPRSWARRTAARLAALLERFAA